MQQCTYSNIEHSNKRENSQKESSKKKALIKRVYFSNALVTSGINQIDNHIHNHIHLEQIYQAMNEEYRCKRYLL